MRNSTPWTPAEDAILTRVYTTSRPIGDAVEATGRAEGACYRRASALGLKRETGRGTGDGVKTREVERLAARPNGVRATEHPELTHLVYRMAYEGHLYPGKLGRRTVHYFTTKEGAERFVANNLPAHAYKVAKKAAQPSARDGWGPNDPIHYPMDEHGNKLYRETKALPPPAMVFRTNTYPPR
jgi:hypothetical protein